MMPKINAVKRSRGSTSRFKQTQCGYSHLTVVACLVNGFTPRVGRRW